MAGKAGLKAGLVGLVFIVVWTVIGRLVPALASGVMVYVSCGVSSLLYLGTGVLAGLWLESPRSAGKGAGAGAIAGLIAGVLGSIVSVVIMLVQFGGTGTIPGLNPEQAQMLADSGMNPQTLMIFSAVCGPVLAAALGAGLGAAGGAISAAIKGE